MSIAHQLERDADRLVSNMDVTTPGYEEYWKAQALWEFMQSKEWIEALEEDSSEPSTDSWQSAEGEANDDEEEAGWVPNPGRPPLTEEQFRQCDE